MSILASPKATRFLHPVQVALFPLILACLVPGGPHRPGIATAAIPASNVDGPVGPCTPVPGLSVLLEPGTVALFGEIHGTREAPAFFGRAICGALEAGHTVAAGLEMPPSADRALDAYLRSDGTGADRARLLADEFWARGYQDGRSSKAIFRLIESLRQLRSSGMPLTVFTFDIEPGLPPAVRERAMAERLLQGARPDDGLVFALTGNLHSRVAGGAPWDPAYVPMGEHGRMAAPDRRWIGLDMSTDGGAAWLCVAGQGGGCGSRSLAGSPGRDPGLHVGDRGPDQPYHGWFHLGPVSASPPAARQSPPES